MYTVNSITTKLKIPVLVSFGIGVANIIGSIVLCVYTDLGVYAIQIVSSVLLTARVFFFAPIYAAHILKQKWWVFYKPLLRGTFSSAIVLTIFFVIVKNITIDSWIQLLLWGAICGVIGYAVNYVVVLNKEERLMAKEIVMKKIKRK